MRRLSAKSVISILSLDRERARAPFVLKNKIVTKAKFSLSLHSAELVQ